MGRVLVACEESQTVCKAFRALGHEAYSCDILAGAVHLYRGGNINYDRLKKLYEAANFFKKTLKLKAKYLCVENPGPLKIAELPAHTQVIQPWQFGHGFTKRTLLWLHNLPALSPTNIVEGRINFVSRRGTRAANGSKSSQKERSKTFPGIAQAMAEQWGALI